jgi:muramoyltetrapeptide carboxypeptidase
MRSVYDFTAHLDRRSFLQRVCLGCLFLSLPHRSTARDSSRPAIKPPRLKPGDTIGLINPAGATFLIEDVRILTESLGALALTVKHGSHLFDHYGYLAGKDVDRAADVNAMFTDRDVKGVLCVRGGWGCNRILPLVDYDLVREHPKVFVGYSDITSLLVALYAKTDLVTFHGPVGISTWNKFSVDYFKRVLFNGEAVTFQNPTDVGDNLTQTKDRVETITPGKAHGRIVGGNLAVLSAMVGSEFVPDWRDHILFLEEDNESIYRVDRMLTQLKIAGILGKLSGFVFGKCTKCEPGEGYGSLALEEVFADHIRPLRIPAWYGAMIGHIENKFTMPIGVEVEIDAGKGSIRMKESAVGNE